MNYRCLRLLATLVAIVLLRTPARCQGPAFLSIRGEIRTDQVLLEGYFVELYDVFNRRGVEHEYVHSDGSFTFRNVPAGDYEIRVTDSSGAVVERQFLTATTNMPPVEIRLPEQRKKRPPSGPVSLTQLKHPPAADAVRALVAAQRFSDAKQYEKAAGELEKAVRISPEYAEAHTNLSAQYVRLGRYEDAVRESQRAMELTRPNGTDLSNMAFALYRLQRYGEAVASARSAVRLDPGNNKAHYMLGSLLVLDRTTLPEGITHLERAVETVPAAQKNLEKAKQLLAGRPPG